ncbi:MAG: hypothetical protein KDD11_18820 [Acidobacteria bacterium]|nr:hypothetical protein [Acidobacteriota bacterium]
MKHWVWITVSVLWGGLWISPADGACRSIKLTPEPYWVSSAAWTPDGAHLLLVDSLTSRVLSYDVNGRQQDLTDEYRGIDGFFPVSVESIPTAAGPKQLLQLTHSRMRVVSFESASSLYAGFDVAPPEDEVGTGPGVLRLQNAQNPLAVEKVWQFALVGDPTSSMTQRRLVGFADVSRAAGGGKDWSFDLVTLPWGQRDRAVTVSAPTVSAPDFDDPVRTYFRLGYPLIAALGQDVFVLRMEEYPKLYQLRGAATGRTELDALAGLDLGQRTALPSFDRFSEAYPQLMQALVDNPDKAPAALYAQGSLLYVLFRQRVDQPSGGTRWTLAAIDPYDENGDYWRGEAEVVGVTSDHLTVVPGDKSWAFIEKGRAVELFTEQDIPTMTLVPTEQVAGIAGGPRSNGLTRLCP